ncbi:MAG: Hsp20/alpha crystallin family protein [Candidatus Heimdallarchaeota archaeon]|nr:MAG: Hsp20/alpha crystallin family protein [Candidatus Heimdallarchaeota archaeon]
MNDKTNDRNEDNDFNFHCFPPFHTFWKTFPRMKPFFKKGFWHSGDWINKGARVPITQVKRDQEKYNITMEIPGISRDEINLEATNDELWFSAQGTEFKNHYRHHFYFKKRIRPNEIKALLKAGILTITAPFVDKVPKTKVNVE